MVLSDNSEIHQCSLLSLLSHSLDWARRGYLTLIFAVHFRLYEQKSKADNVD